MDESADGVTDATGRGAPQTASDRMRRATRVLTLTTLAGLAAELAYSRHWGSLEQRIPWACVAIVAVALWLVSPVRSAAGLTAARALIIAVFLASLFGVWEHIKANHDAGPLDFKYATTWHTFSGARQWWMAISGGVGPAPPLVPLAMVLAAALVWICTLGQVPRPRRA